MPFFQTDLQFIFSPHPPTDLQGRGRPQALQEGPDAAGDQADAAGEAGLQEGRGRPLQLHGGR